MKKILSLFVLILAVVSTNSVQADHTPNPSSVTIAGSLQSELGCPGDWQPDCANTYLNSGDDDVWQGSFNIPAGSWEYKAALNASWDENYGANAQQNGPNIPLNLAADQTVKFFYDHKSHWITDNVNSVIATVPGSYQQELGCPGDWQPDCLRSWLQDSDGDGIYSFSTSAIPPGNYEAKVAHNETWDENYGQGGVQDGPNIPFSVGTNQTITFTYDPVTHVLDIEVEAVNFAIIHYFREDSDYGDHTTGDSNDFWGLQLWGDIGETIEWTDPKPFLGQDEYGRFAWVKLLIDADNVGFIVHRGDTKDGTDADRFFTPGDTPEIWLKSNDANFYISQADAQGFVTIHYHRDDGDYGDPTSSNYNDFWGLHLWGDAIDPSELTEWSIPKPFDGVDDYGAFWNIQIVDSSQPVNFIIHRGDSKDPGPDQGMVPVEGASVWINSGDEMIYPQRGAAQNFATIHYHRDDGDYGDPTSSNYNDFWGLHVWTGAANPNPSWQEPVRWESLDIFGPVFKVDLVDGASELAYIIHRGDTKDPDLDQFLSFNQWGYEVWQLQDADTESPYILPVFETVNHPPTVTADENTLTINEGDMAANVGTAGDIDGDSLTLSASAGTVINNNNGAWSWSYMATDGPDDSQTVTITAEDGKGGIAQTTFELSVNNVAPTINSINIPDPILEGSVVEISVDASDPAGISDPLTYYFDCDNDGIFEIGPQATATTTCSFGIKGVYNVKAQVEDDDGGTATDTTTVTVLTPQEAIDDFIVSEIEDLTADGDLNQGQGNALLVKLYQAIQQLNQGKTNVAINLLGAFINQVNDFIREEILTAEEGQALIDAANDIIDTISG